jgi:hypothetical protein
MDGGGKMISQFYWQQLLERRELEIILMAFKTAFLRVHAAVPESSSPTPALVGLSEIF